MEEEDGERNVSLVSLRRKNRVLSTSRPPLPPRKKVAIPHLCRKRQSFYRLSDSDSSVSSEDCRNSKEPSECRSQPRYKEKKRCSSLSRLFKRKSLIEEEYKAQNQGEVSLLSYRKSNSLLNLVVTGREIYGCRGVMMEGSDQRTNPDSSGATSLSLHSSNIGSSHFLSGRQNGGEKMSCLMEDKKFMHIPPPAGFDSPMRPSTLLAALVRGPVSLDEANLSPATQRRLAYIHRHTQSSYQIRVQNIKEGSAVTQHATADSSSSFSKGDFWSDFPTSPLSPPSPFQHPFFRRQLGLLPPDPWSRFSGFGLPLRNPPYHVSASRDSSSQPEEEDEEAGGKDNGRKRTSRESKYYVSSSNSSLCYCQDSKSYNVSRDSQFFAQTYSDGVSETESEDDEEEAFATPVTSQNLLFSLNNNNTNNNHIQASNSSSEDLLPASSTSTGSNNNSSNLSIAVGPPSPKLHYSHSPMSDTDAGSKRNSQAISSEADFDDISSLTTSEPDSYHDAPSPRSSLHSPDICSRIPSSVYEESDEKLVSAREFEEAEILSSTHQDAPNKSDRLHKIALELLHSERSYVSVLHIIDQEFQFRVDQQNRVHHLFPPDQMPLMFSNIKSIYKLHHDFLLPQLEERMTQWEKSRKIGDIMKSFAPFLKMYTEYVRNFDNAMTLISSWQAKSSRFAAIMDEIHSLQRCGNLTLQHHMLSPVQRIPRYEMLLKDYLRKLPENHQDRRHTEEALHLVSMAANHANDAMKKIDKFQKLLEVQESLGGAIELVSPTRELLKEGRIIKISARSGDHQERYLFLFSDLLLLCTPRLISGRVISGPQYRLRARYKVENLEVLEGDNLETANTFYIRDSNKTVELYTQTKEEKELWLNALFQAINETYRRKSSLRLSNHSDPKVPDPDLGLKQPILIRTDSVTKCMECGSHFSVVRRKHHCRACGSVVCNKCSNHKAILPCESGRNVRVCRTCHAALAEMSSGTSSPSPETEHKEEETGPSRSESTESTTKYENFSFKSRGVLDVPASVPGAIMQGYLQLKTHRKAWVKRWFALHPDFVLYSFKTDEDQLAITATPVPGFTVVALQNTKAESGVNEKDRDKGFKLYHAKKQYVFLCSAKDDAVRWIAALQKASHAELPSPVQ